MRIVTNHNGPLQTMFAHCSVTSPRRKPQFVFALKVLERLPRSSFTATTANQLLGESGLAQNLNFPLGHKTWQIGRLNLLPKTSAARRIEIITV